MKKRVRIYKAQNGMQVPPQVSDQKIAEAASILIADQGLTAEEAIAYLVQQVQGVDPRRVQEIVIGLANAVEEKRLAMAAEENGDQTTLNRIDQSSAIDEAAAEEEERRKAQLQQMYYSDYSQQGADDEEQMLMQDLTARQGMSMPSKRTFKRQYVRQAKEGMQTEKADSTDPGDRKLGLDTFVKNLQYTADSAIMEDDAAKLYDMYQQNSTQFAKGGQNKIERQMSRLIRNLPAGYNMPSVYSLGQSPLMAAQYAYPFMPQEIDRIDVDKTRLFSGKPKDYTVYFRPSQSRYTDTIPEPDRRVNETALEEVDQAVNTDNKKAAADQQTKQNEANAQAENAAKKEALVSESDIRVVSPGDKSLKKSQPKSEEELYIEEESKNVNPNKVTIPEFGGLSDFAYATADEYAKSKNEYFAKSVKVNGKDVMKKFTYNPVTKKWYREGSSKPIESKESIDLLNTWRNNYNKNLKQQASETYLDQWTQGFTPTKPGRPSFDVKLKSKEELDAVTGKRVKLKPIEVTGLNPGNPDDWGSKIFSLFLSQGVNPPPGQFTLKPMGPYGSPYALPGGRGLNPGQPMLNPGQPMLNPGQRMLPGPQRLLGPGQGFQMGGFSDADSGLYKFIYGGNDVGALPPAGGVLTDSPYFRDGGLYKFQGENDSEVDNTNTPLTAEERAWIAQQMQAQQQAQGMWENIIQGKGQPQPGQSYDDWWTSDGSTPGFRPDNRIWNGTEWVESSENINQYGYPRMGQNPSVYPGYGLPYNNPYIGNQYMGAGYNPYSFNQPIYPPLFGRRRANPAIQYAGSWLQQRGLPIDMATGQRYTGAFDNPELAKFTAKGVRRSGVPRRVEAEYLVDDWDPYNTMGTKNKTAKTDEFGEPIVKSGRRYSELVSSKEGLKEWLKGAPKPFEVQKGDYYSPDDPVADYLKKSLTLPEQPEAMPSGYPVVTSGPRNTGMAYGGYLPKAQMYNSQIGSPYVSDLYEETPINDDPRIVPYPELSFIPPDIDDLDLTDTIPVDEEDETPIVDNRSEWDPSRMMTKEQAEREGIEWREPEPKIDYAKKRLKVKYKNKNMYNIDPEAMIQGTNRFLSNAAYGTDALRGMKNMKKYGRMLPYMGDTTSNPYDRGTTEINSGTMFPDDLVVAGARRGGSMYKQGGTHYMSQKDIQKFLEEGGELEFV